MMGCRTKKLVGSLFKITVGAFGGKPFSKVANMVMGFFDASISGQASNLSPSSMC